MTREERLEMLTAIIIGNPIGEIELTDHDKGHKMAGIQSVSSNVLTNKFCQARRLVPGSVCQQCYAETLSKCRTNLSKKLARNTGRLTSHALADWEIPHFKTKYGRIESFGDTQSVLHACNYLRIIKANPNTQFGIWSKNIDHWREAFEILGKPENCTFVYSSQIIGLRSHVPENCAWFVDHVFTVWYPESHPTNCAGIQCMSCLKCYREDSEFYIDEILR